MAKKIRKAPHSARYVAVAAKTDSVTLHDVPSAITALKASTSTKFVESVDLAIRLGIDPRKGDQNVRGITNLPHGTGKVRRIAVLAKGDLAKEAEAAGADKVGAEDLIAEIQNGFRGFDVLMATEEMAPQIGKIGRLLGPKTPNKKNGTVTNQIATAVKEVKAATRIEYRAEKAGVVHVLIGKVNFTDEQLSENLHAALSAIIRAKPSSAKGRYLESITLSTTMGPAVRVDPTAANKFAG